MRGVSTRPRKAVAEASKTVNKVLKSRSWLALDCAEKHLQEPFWVANFEDLEQFLKVLQTRYGNIPEFCDQEECLREVVHNRAGRLGMPTRVTAVEQSQANGRAEQRVRALRERLQILVEDARRRSTEITLDHPVAQWAVRHAEWIQNFLVKSRCRLDRRWNNKNHQMKRTQGTEHRAMLLDFWSEFLFETNLTMTNSPDS